MINQFLTPDDWHGFLHRLPEGGPVTFPLFGVMGAYTFLAPHMPCDVCVGARRTQLRETVDADATTDDLLAFGTDLLLT